MPLDHYRTLGRSGLRVSPLCMGAMGWGSTERGSDEDEAFRIMDRFVELGGNFLDTSNAYVEGESERVVGRYLAGRPGRRDRLVIATKFSSNLFHGDPNGGGGGRKALRNQIEGSLTRLGVDYIDLYWQHHFDRHTPIEETMDALNDLVRQGKILYIGISDTPAWTISQAATTADFRGWAPVTAMQLEYSLLARTVEGELLPLAESRGIGITPFSPLAGGVLTGKYTRENPNPAGSARGGTSAGFLAQPNAFDIIDTLRRIADERGTSVAAVALGWVLSKPVVTSPLIGPRTMAQFEDNLPGVDVVLTEKEVAELDELSAPTLNFPAAFLQAIAIDRQQAGTTINGIPSKLYIPK
ncbi:aldo/keto reductase [Pseudonocardia sp. CA-107938]|uniref:aldo/keto reductase n=1 Tax=Pseudonocardia sp. CA-107938 TaxID=3240021 RepID=UPI003D8EC649